MLLESVLDYICNINPCTINSLCLKNWVKIESSALIMDGNYVETGKNV